MNNFGFEVLQAEIENIQVSKWVGRVTRVSQTMLDVSGLRTSGALGDLVEIIPVAGRAGVGEIVQIDGATTTVLPDGMPEGIQIGDRVVLIGQDGIAPHDSWIGRMIDPYGRALNGPQLLRGPDVRPLRGAAMNPTDRRALGPRLETGMTVFNTFLPIARGQRIGIFAGSGVGKSTLLGKLAIGLQADIAVIAMIGERGREVQEFVERILGPRGMERAIVVAATSDQSALTRRRCAWSAMAIAEHFRDAGHQVLFIADSITRFAQAHREVALAAGEPGSMRGYPPSTASVITALCERAGPGGGTSADITAVFSVLVAGSDMEEPVADIMRGVLDGHVVLDREIAERGRFPAIDVLRSVSRSLPQVASDSENALLGQARALLGTYDRNEIMIRAGLYERGSDAEIDAAISAWPRLDEFVAQSEFNSAITSFSRLEACLDPALADSAATAESPV